MIQLHAQLAGRFKLRTRRFETPWQDNLVLDTGLDMLGINNSIPGTHAYVGAGTQQPSPSDTALVSPIGSTSNITETDSPARRTGVPYWVGRRQTFDFSGVTGGINEVGVGDSNTLFSRVVLDNPVTVLADDNLEVIYEFRFYINEADQPWSDTINGTPTSGVIRPGRIDEVVFGSAFLHNQGVTATDGTLGAITEFPSGNRASGDMILRPYTPGTFYRDIKCDFGQNQGNIGIATIFTEPTINDALNPCLQMSFNPPVPKTDRDVFSTTIRYSWGRYAG